MSKLQLLFQSYTETPNEVVGKVQGKIPEWLNGKLIRNGPAKWDLDKDYCMSHFFDGASMLTKYEVDGKTQQARASTRFLRSTALNKMEAVKRPVYTEFGTKAFPDTTKSIWSRMMNKLVPSDLTDNDFANVYQVQDELYVSTESCNLWQVSPDDLSSLVKVNLDKHPGIAICCSHPQISDEGVFYNVGASFMTGMKYHVMQVPPKGQSANDEKKNINAFQNSSMLTTISSTFKGSMSYSHSFGMTENYIVIIEQPLLINGLKLVTCTPKGKSLKECLDWLPDQPALYHVIDKRTGVHSSLRYKSKGYFFLHTINAFEKDNQLVLDIITYEDHSVFDNLEIDSLRNGDWNSDKLPVPMRYVLPLGDAKSFKPDTNLVTLDKCSATAKLASDGVIELTPAQLGPAGFENPSMHPQKRTKQYKYVYGSGLFEKGFYANSICKLDLESEQVLLYKQSEEFYPGEALFIARPDGEAEDDGVLLTQVLSTVKEKDNFLAILDAKNLQELARVTFSRSDITLPPSIHGTWISNKN